MKTIIVFFALLVIIDAKGNAQSPETDNPDQFLFPEFTIGVIKLKNGEKVNLNLNYNIVSEKMVFYQNDQLFDVINRSAIDTVYIQSRKFITADNSFFEVIVPGPTTLLAQNTGKVKSPPRPAAYDGTSEVSSSTYIDNMRFGGEVYRMKRDAPVIVIPEVIYWVKTSEALEPVTGKGKLLKLLDDRKPELKSRMNSDDFDIREGEDLVNLIAYYNSLGPDKRP